MTLPPKSEWLNKALPNVVKEISSMIDVQSVSMIVARHAGMTVARLQVPRTRWSLDQTARTLAVAMALRFTKEPVTNIMAFFGYETKTKDGGKKSLKLCAKRFDDAIDGVLKSFGIPLPQRRNLDHECKSQPQSSRKDINASLIEMLLSLKAWDIDGAYTHPDDFAGRYRGARIFTLERMGLIEAEFDCNEKWYRLTDDGRKMIEQHQQGVPLNQLFAPFKKNRKYKSIKELIAEQQQQEVAA